MRFKSKASNLRKGQIAYLPYFGRLLRAKITGTNRHSGAYHNVVSVIYEVLSEPCPRTPNQCNMHADSEYEVYQPPPRKP